MPNASIRARAASALETSYEVEAIDGSIGKIDDATLETDSGHLVVDTGPWIFGKKIMLPAGVLKTVDHVNEKVFVNRTKDEIKNAPESTRSERKVPHRARHVLRPGGRGYCDWD